MNHFLLKKRSNYEFFNKLKMIDLVQCILKLILFHSYQNYYINKITMLLFFLYINTIKPLMYIHVPP